MCLAPSCCLFTLFSSRSCDRICRIYSYYCALCCAGALTLFGAEKAVLKELLTKIESNKNQQDLVFVCTSSHCFLQFQAFCFHTKKQPVLRCQPGKSLRSHQVQQEGLSISVRPVQPAKVHSFHSTKRLALSSGLFMLGRPTARIHISHYIFCLKRFYFYRFL